MVIRDNIKLPPRIAMRPDPKDWDNDESLTLDEAAALFWPHGPLTTTSLRTAIKDKQLAFVAVAGKFLTTPAALKEMVRPTIPPPTTLPTAPDGDDDADLHPAPRAGPPRHNHANAAQKALIDKLSSSRRRREPPAP